MNIHQFQLNIIQQQPMNVFQRNMYNGLMALVDGSDTFYFADREIHGIIFRIFNYRMTSYTEFLQPYALECRGTTFAMKDGEPYELAAIAFEKFFNLNENPMAMGLDLTTVVEINDKADGSFISSYMIGDELLLKSKGSVGSSQAVNSTAWIHLPENEPLMKEVIGAND